MFTYKLPAIAVRSRPESHKLVFSLCPESLTYDRCGYKLAVAHLRFDFCEKTPK